jgi:hypothetical protein
MRKIYDQNMKVVNQREEFQRGTSWIFLKNEFYWGLNKPKQDA